MSAHAVEANVAPPAGLLVTKMHPPRLRGAASGRRRLLEFLCVDPAPLVVVTAAAGFGKSTLLGHWVASLDRHVGWVSLDEGDNDATRFWSHVIASLNGALPRFSAYGVEVLRAPAAPPIGALLTELVNELASAESVVLVLDDYHHIDAPSIHEGVTFLINHLPESVIVGIGSRSEPPLPLARLRGRGEVREIDADALRATAEEAGVFLRSGMNLDLSEQAVETVLRKTEGWFAGLQLAALTLRGREGDPSAIEAFSGEHRLVLDYMTEEVLKGQSPEVQAFLVDASILSRMDAAVCDAVLDRDDSAAMLRYVGGAHLFVDALDDTETWWRFHALFADLLQARLLRTDPERSSALHGRAARAFVALGDVGEAVRHHLAAGEVGEAAVLVARSTPELVEVGGIATLQRWLGAIPAAEFAQHPELFIARAWATAYTGDTPSVPALLADAEAALAARDGREGSWVGDIAALRTHVASLEGRTREAIELAQEALARIDGTRHWVRGNLEIALGFAHQYEGMLSEAAEATSSSARTFAALGNRHGWLYATYQLGEIRRYGGSLSAAKRTYLTMLGGGPVKRLEREPAFGNAHVGLAKVALERFELDDALRHAEEGRAGASVLGLGTRVDAVLTLALVQQACGDLAAAEATFQQAWEEAQASTRFAWVDRRVATLRSMSALSRGRLDVVTAWRATLGDAWDLPLGDTAGWPGYLTRHPTLVTLIRLSLTEGDLASVERRLSACLEAAERSSLVGHVLELLTLQAEARRRAGRRDEARAILASVLERAAPERYVYPLLAGGSASLGLIRAAAASGDAHATHVLGCARARGAVMAGHSMGEASTVTAGRSNPKGDVRTTPASRDVPSHEPLTDRERTVVRLLSTGAPNKALAKELHLSVNTIKTHVRVIYAKLGVSSRAELAALVHERKLLG